MEQKSQIFEPLNANMVEPTCQIARLDTGQGRAYYDTAANDESLRHYFYGVTSILDGALAKGIGFSKWLGDSPASAPAME